MERKVGEIFEFQNKKLCVEKEECDLLSKCKNCFFDKNGRCVGLKHLSYIGHCVFLYRNDCENVIFVEVKDNH